VTTRISFTDYHHRCQDFCSMFFFSPAIGRKTVHSA
jgi:hypothetical protein